MPRNSISCGVTRIFNVRITVDSFGDVLLESGLLSSLLRCPRDDVLKKVLLKKFLFVSSDGKTNK